MSLFLLSSILFLFPILIKFFHGLTLPEDSFDIDIFILDIYEELDVTDKYDIKRQTSNELILKNASKTINYRLSNKRLIKSINNQGFITLMYDVEIFSLIEDKNKVILKIGEKDAYQTLTFKK